MRCMSRIIIISPQAPTEFLELLEKEGCEFIFTKEQSCLPYPERYHADLQAFAPDKHTLVTTPLFYEYYKNLLAKRGITVLCGKTEADGHYPTRIAYNVGRVGKRAFCLEKAVDSVVREELIKRNVSLCNVPQGYAACSMVSVTDRALITSDMTIQKAAEKEGLDCLYVSPDTILLPGFDHGLIGGCVSNIRENEFAVAGSELPNSFQAFFYKHGATLIRIPGPLFDFGGSLSLEGK